MRLGGGIFRTGFARGVVFALFTATALIGAATPSPAADPATDHLYAIVRTPDGGLEVVSGVPALVAQADAALGRDTGEVVAMGQSQEVHALGDPRRWEQWALDRTSYEATWPNSSGFGITVAVVDSGVSAGHQDLVGKVLNGVDYAADESTYDPAGLGRVDPSGHGTHVAGIIAANYNNNVGVTGAAPNVKILPVRVLSAGGGGSTAAVAAGIIWAADHGARVINLSVGGPGADEGMHDAVKYAVSKKVVVVGAGGNNRLTTNYPVYPGAFPEAIAVASVDSNLKHSAFSVTGGQIDIAAPGESVLSTYGASIPNDYAYMSGTSMASPYVAAAAALVLSENSALSPSRVASILKTTAIDLGAPGRDDDFGAGLVNPKSAVVAASPLLNGGTKGNGYWIVGVDGSVHTYGTAKFYGDLRSKRFGSMIVAGARTPDGKGYWLAAANGAVYTFGNAEYHGGKNGQPLNAPIVGMAPTPSGHGYVLLAKDGGIFTFGDANFYGSTGNKRLNAPVLDMTLTTKGRGYYFVAGDGGVFTFGDAKFRGSTGNIRLNEPVRSMTTAADGSGYWMVARDGGIFAYGVPYKGSLPAVRQQLDLPQSSTVRMRALTTKDGYYMLQTNGTVYAFGAAKNYGSASGVLAVDLMLAP
jgi:subtilisin family serine protease